MTNREADEYLDVLHRVHLTLLPRTYVEIGVASGKTLCLVPRGTSAIGIDPEPKLEVTLPPTTRVVTATSDEFFAESDVLNLLQGHPIDLSFIDGMHQFDYALRDFMNLERHSSPGSVILLDDCYPRDESMLTGANVKGAWTGDVFKVVMALRDYRPDLRIATVDALPAGLTIVASLDPDSMALDNAFDEILARYESVGYGEFARVSDDILGLIPNRWRTVRAHLPEHPFRTGERWTVIASRLALLRRRARRRAASSPIGPTLAGLKSATTKKRSA